MVLRLIRALPGDRLFCHRRSRDNPATLMPASGHQDHTPSPSASAPPVLRRRCVHRIPLPTSVTTAKRPSCGSGTAERIHIFWFSEREIFARGQPTAQIRLNQLTKLDFTRTRFFVPGGVRARRYRTESPDDGQISLSRFSGGDGRVRWKARPRCSRSAPASPMHRACTLACRRCP
jgi:hypothetical protein